LVVGYFIWLCRRKWLISDLSRFHAKNTRKASILRGRIPPVVCNQAKCVEFRSIFPSRFQMQARQGMRVFPDRSVHSRTRLRENASVTKYCEVFQNGDLKINQVT